MPIGSLGYIGFSASDLAAWRKYGEDFLGVMVAEQSEERLRFRIDSQAWRIAVEAGSADDLAYVGFEVPGPDDLEEMRRVLTAAGVAFSDATPEHIQDRRVSGMITCQDPDGLPVEIYYGPVYQYEIPFVSTQGVSGFVTEGQGVGHVVIGAADMAAARRFYCDTLGFKLSDVISFEPVPGITVALDFLHCNPRHHTLALAQARPGRPKRLNHFMLQTNTLDEVGFAMDRAEACGVPITSTLGKHTNDHMVSFYAATPSGFDVEYGYGARTVDDATWRVVRHEKTSSWGHHRPAPPR